MQRPGGNIPRPELNLSFALEGEFGELYFPGLDLIFRAVIQGFGIGEGDKAGELAQVAHHAKLEFFDGSGEDELDV